MKTQRFFIWIIVAIGVIVVGFILLPQFFGYLWYQVADNQVGVKFSANQPYEVVGPGVWTDLYPFRDIKSVKISALPFNASDSEVLTKDQQRIGVAISGNVFRKAAVLLKNWIRYQIYYLEDESLVGSKSALLPTLSQQAIRACITSLTFDEAAVGGTPDKLRECIAHQLVNLTQDYGLEVKNIVVSNVILPKEVQKKLDEIKNTRYAVQMSELNILKVKADAESALAFQQGRIRLEEGRIQEKAKQEADTIKLKTALLQEQRAHELLAAEQEEELAKIRLRIAQLEAQATLAPKEAEAKIHSDHPEYVELLKSQALAAAWKNTDKVMVIPNNTIPFMILGQDLPKINASRIVTTTSTTK